MKNKEHIHFVISYTRMKARLLYGEEMKNSEVIKEFNLNKGTIGTLIDRFYYTHKGDSSTTKHDIIANLGKPSRGIPTTPDIQIYPIIGENVISSTPIKASWIQGTYEDYLKNHKHYDSHEN